MEEYTMKNIVKHIALAALVATVVAPAQAGVMDAAVSWRNSACALIGSAGSTLAAMPRSVGNWFVNASTVIKLTCNKPITLDESESLERAIKASISAKAEQDKHSDNLANYLSREKNSSEGILETRKVAAKILAIPAAVTTGIILTSIAAVYAYKRFTARPAIAGWC
jgi:hypothetical protein